MDVLIVTSYDCMYHYLCAVYVNHRPVFGLSPRQIGGAFKILGEKTEGEWHWEVLRSELLALLQERGMLRM